MGCDIHVIAEVRHVWASRNGQPPRVDPWKAFTAPGIWHQRNYEVFANLCGVRNYYDIIPIDDPRGWPEDMSEAGRRWVEAGWEGDDHDLLYEVFRCGTGDHSASWVTLDELKAHGWNTNTRKSVIIPKADYDRWDGKGRPPGDMHCRNIAGTNVKVAYLDPNDNPDQYGYHLGKCATSLEEATHVQVAFNEPSIAQEHVNNLIQSLEFCREWGDSEEIRLVFNFDS